MSIKYKITGIIICIILIVFIFCQTFDNTSVSGNESTDVYEIQNPNLDNNEAENHNAINSDENISIGNNSPDSGFINTLRYGMLAVRLLPCSSISSKF